MATRTSRLVTGVALTLATVVGAGTVAVLAARSPGYASTSVDTTQRAAWVTSGQDLMVGLLNRQINEVQSPASLDSAQTDLLQTSSAVVLVDRKQHQLRALDPASVTLSGKLTLPRESAEAMSDSTLAVADTETGKVWLMPTDGLGTGDLTAEAPTATTSPGAVLAVAGDTAYVTAPGMDSLIAVKGGGDGPARPTGTKLPGGALSPVTPLSFNPVSISMVGTTPVVLDAVSGRLIAGQRSIPLPADAKNPVLQQSGPASTFALVAVDGALLRVDLADGTITRANVPGSRATAPVWVAGCAHSAWSQGTPTYLAWCGDGKGDPDPAGKPIDKIVGDSQLIFRVNGRTVVLNDTMTGNAWVLDEDLTLINNWDQIRADQNNLGTSDSGAQGNSKTVTTTRTECKGDIAGPSAKDDDVVARPGKPRVLDVLANDNSSACGIATIAKIDGPKGIAVIVNDGQSIQVTLPAQQKQPVDLGYTVTNGRGQEATARVTVTPYTDTKSLAPKMLRKSATAVVIGGTVTHEVLSDYTSPSGDTLFLADAHSDNPDDRVSYTPDGNITVGDAGKAGASKKTIFFTVSDGAESTPGQLTVEVLDEAKATPVASQVVASGAVGQQIKISPLTSVFWPGVDALALTRVQPHKDVTGITVTPDYSNGTALVSAGKPGSYYLDYQVAAGDKQATGLIRVDVHAAEDQTAPIVATDTAFVPQDGQALVDLTRNDSDPAGGIVAVQQIKPPDDSGLVIQLIDMHLAKVSTRRALPAGGIWVRYTASSGGPTAEGWLHVVAVPQPSAPMSPVASAITVAVRFGDAVTIPIDQHAIDPAGGLLRPVAFDADAIGADQGLLFVTDDSIRYMAPASDADRPMTLRTPYTVVNLAGKKSSANLVIRVLPTGKNSPPLMPPTASARVFVGGTMDIPLPIDGIDPDGDWAIATSIVDPPQLGRAGIAGTSSIRYTGFDQPGLDTFTYTAADPFGGSVTGTVNVLVVPLPATAEPPVLPDLEITMQPDRSMAVNVLAQATDPAGQKLDFPANPVALPSAKSGISIDVRGGVLIVKSGPGEVKVPVQVTVQNAQQRKATATMMVTVSKNAPIVPPTARDVLVSEAMLQPGGKTASVDVAPWVANPGGLPEDLVASVPTVSQNRLTTKPPRTLSVPITEHRQVLAYQVTNLDKLAAQAFVIVPSRAELNLPPPPDPSNQPQESKPNTTAAPSTVAQTKQSRSAPKTTPKPQPLTPTSLKSLTVNAGERATIRVADYVGGAKAGASITVPGNSPLRATVGTLTRLDAATLQWSVPQDAGGQAQLYLTVTDGAAPAAKASIPATIIPAKPKPPVFQGADITVEAGSTADPVALSPLVSYDDDKRQNLTFSEPTGGSDGLTASLQDGALVVRAASGVPKGTTAQFQVTVNDKVNPPVSATFTATVISSSKPLARLAAQKITAQAGKPTTVNVFDGATNPFDPEPLTLLPVKGGTNYAATSSADGTLTITPKADYSGGLTVAFTVADASKDAARNVPGAVTVTVVGKPDSPGVPRMVSAGDSTASIQWAIPDDNGSPIDYYTVTGSNGFSQKCPTSPCKLSNLKNNVAYTFTVTAHNAVGDSVPSSSSAQIRPDTAPQAPDTPTLTFGDGQLLASWTKPANTGSPITSYEVTIAPAPAGGPATVKLPANQTRYTFTKLENGTSYTVTVRALNSSGTPGDTSGPATEIPAGKPGIPADLTLSAADASGTAKRVDLSWTAPQANGDAPSYEVHWVADGGAEQVIQVAAGTTKAAIDPAENGVQYTVTVLAVNKAGKSDASAPAQVTPFAAPGQVTDLKATPTGQDGTVALAWSAPPANGRPIDHYLVNDGVSGFKPANGNATTFTATGLQNGTAYTFQVRACNAETSSGSNCGADSNGAPATPYRPPGPPQNVLANPDPAPNQIVLSWAPPADNGGRAITGYQWAPAGSGSWTDAGAATSVTIPAPNGTQVAYDVRAYTAEATAQFSDPVSSNAATPYGVPDPPARLTAEATGETGKVRLTWANGGDGGSPITGYQVTVNPSGKTVDVGGPSTGTVVDVSNGNPHTFTIKAINKRGASGPSNTSNEVIPYGPVPDVTNPGASTVDANTVKFTWDPPPSNGIGGYTYVAGGDNVGTTQSATKNGTCGGNDVSINVHAVDSAGHAGNNITITGKTGACPRNPTAYIRGWKSADGHLGSSPDSTRCNGSKCIFIEVGVNDFKPGVSVRCDWNLGGTLTRFHTFTTNSSGNASYQSQTYTDARPLHVSCTGGGETATDTLN